MMLAVLSVIVAAVQQIVSAGCVVLKHCFIKFGKAHPTVRCHCRNRVKGKVVVITGATSGIGRFTALDLAKKGATVYLACRNRRASEKIVKDLIHQTGNLNIHFLYLNLTDLSSVLTFVKEFKKCEEKLDVLVNNAGVFHHPPNLTQDKVEVTYQTNYLGVFHLTSLLLDTLKKTPRSQIIFVSSEAHKFVSVGEVESFDPRKLPQVEVFNEHVRLYGISKLALRLFAFFVAEEYPDILVASVNPGNVWTPIFRHAWLSWKGMLTRVWCFLCMKEVSEGAQPLIHALNTATLPSGCYLSDQLEIEDTSCYDRIITKKLMEESIKLVGQHLQ